MPLTDEQLAKFFELLQEIVDDPRPWRDKREALQRAASEMDRDNIEEFTGWFD